MSAQHAFQWVTHTRLKSDLLPIVIIIKLASSVSPCCSDTFTNYKKENWESFRRETKISEKHLFHLCALAVNTH